MFTLVRLELWAKFVLSRKAEKKMIITKALQFKSPNVLVDKFSVCSLIAAGWFIDPLEIYCSRISQKNISYHQKPINSLSMTSPSKEINLFTNFWAIS